MCLQLERQYREVVDERETLSAEVFRLKEEIRRKEEERTSLNSYDPNGPNALQRKIGKASLVTVIILLLGHFNVIGLSSRGSKGKQLCRFQLIMSRLNWVNPVCKFHYFQFLVL